MNAEFDPMILTKADQTAEILTVMGFQKIGKEGTQAKAYY